MYEGLVGTSRIINVDPGVKGVGGAEIHALYGDGTS